jgi:hypothetical protein
VVEVEHLETVVIHQLLVEQVEVVQDQEVQLQLLVQLTLAVEVVETVPILEFMEQVVQVS